MKVGSGAERVAGVVDRGVMDKEQMPVKWKIALMVVVAVHVVAAAVAEEGAEHKD